MPTTTHVSADELLTLAELSSCCGLTAEQTLVLVSEGVINPLGRDPSEWRFALDDLRRAQSVLRIQRDLGANCAGAALAVDLLDEMQRLRSRIRLLETLIFDR
ncbi:MAG: MerR family transcriptional regulator [Gammaproteobacteria bacterium]|nr:MerR family transcriptional regulator [Gammaproteobacteria bacterium]